MRNRRATIKRKIALVGVEKSGKTQLAVGLSASRYQYSDEYSPKKGRNYDTWELADYQRTGSDIGHHLDIWDIKDKESLSLLMPLHLTGIDADGVVIFALDPTQDFNWQKKYLEEIHQLFKQRDVKGRAILAVTKSDVPENKWHWGFSREKAVTLANKLGIKDVENDIVYCSAPTKKSMNQLLDRVTFLRPELLQQLDEIDLLEEHLKKKIIPILEAEQQTLLKIYGFPIPHSANQRLVTDTSALKRLEALDDTMTGLWNVMEKIRNREIPTDNKKLLQKVLEHPIKKNLDNFDKRKGAWGKKLARVLLNVLMGCTLFILPGVKKLATGTAFFSLEGRTADAGHDALKQARKATASLTRKK